MTLQSAILLLIGCALLALGVLRLRRR